MLIPLLFLALLITSSKYFLSRLFFSLLLLEIYLSMIICSELFLLYLFPTSQMFIAISSGTRLVRNLQKAFQKASPAFSAHLLSTEIHVLFTGVGYLNIFLAIIILLRQ